MNTLMNQVPFKWKCPYCRQIAEITYGDFDKSEWTINLPKLQPHYCRVFETLAIACPNPDCHKLTLKGILHNAYRYDASVSKTGQSREFLWEPTVAQPLPEQVPEQIRKDYEEAWSIVDLSPKAAATLARRALQGMIRHFWNIKKRTLNDEIQALRAMEIDPETLAAIDTVRKMGNIGAHMDIESNVILDVQPEETRSLIWLVEELAIGWYVRLQERNARLEELKKLAASKTS